MKRAQKNSLRITEADIARLSPAAREKMRAEGLLPKERDWSFGKKDRGSVKGKRWEVSWYSPWLKKRVQAGALIEADTKSGAIAELKASLGHRAFDRRQKLRPTNFIATEVHRNPARPFFCADCDGELKGESVMMADGRVVHTRCAKVARQKRQDKSQRKLFDEQSQLFPNPELLRNVEMGFVDRVGVFHPIRKSKDYNEFRSGDLDSPAEKRERAGKHRARIDRERITEFYQDEEKRLAKQFAKKHRSLSQFVRASGGISAPKGHDLRGELRMLGRHESGTTGLLNQRNRIGGHRFGPEHMMDAANTEGFRDQHGQRFDNIGSFLQAVADDAGGIRKFYSDEAKSSYYNPMAVKKKKTKRRKTADGRRAAGTLYIDYKGGQFIASDKAGLSKNLHIYTVSDLKRLASDALRFYSKIEWTKRARAELARRKRNPPPQGAKSPKQNLFGLDRQSRIARKKKRARVLSAKASVLEAKEQLKRARKNPPRKAAKNGVLRNEEFGYEVNTRNKGRVAGTIKGRNAKAVAAALKEFYQADGVKSIRVWRVKVKANPMHPLEIVSHVASGIAGAATAQKLFASSKKRKPGGSKRPVGVRYYLYVGADRRGNHIDTKPEAVAVARSLANSTGATVTVRKLTGTKTKAVKVLRPQRKRNTDRRPKTGDGRKKKTNPNAGRIHHEFTGTPASHIETGFVVPANAPANVDQLGRLVGIKLANGKLLSFRSNPARLCATETAGRRRMIIALKSPYKMPNGSAAGQAYDYGEVAEVSYRARKPHLYHNAREFEFYHRMGEEGGRRPHLILRNGALELRGGDYSIKREGIRN
jgi:hypothetical protein